MRLRWAPDTTEVTSRRLSSNASSRARMTSARVRFAPVLLRIAVVRRSSSSNLPLEHDDRHLGPGFAVGAGPAAARAWPVERASCGPRRHLDSILTNVVASTNLKSVCLTRRSVVPRQEKSAGHRPAIAASASRTIRRSASDCRSPLATSSSRSAKSGNSPSGDSSSSPWSVTCAICRVTNGHGSPDSVRQTVTRLLMRQSRLILWNSANEAR